MLDIVFIAFTGMALAITFDDFQKPGMIFHWWRKILDRNEDMLVLKVLGGCLDCTTVWAVVLMLLLNTFFYESWLVLSTISIGNLWLAFYIKYIN